MQKVNKDDYAIVRDDKNRYHLVLVQAIHKDGSLFCVYEKSRMKEPREETLSAESVVVNLGPNPPPGTVYGCDVQLFRYSLSSGWGSVHFFRDLDKDEKSKLRLALKHAYTQLEERKLSSFLPIDIEVRYPRGKYEGWYKHAKGGDVMRLMPKIYDTEALLHTIFHEAGHGVWWNLVPNHIKAEWILCYYQNVSISNATAQSILDLGKQCSAADSTHDVLSVLDEEEAAVFNACLAYIANTHYISRDDLNILLAARKPIKNYWPRLPMQLADIETQIGEYAGKNVNEFFAEAFRIFMCAKLPATLHRLMIKTLSRTIKATTDAE